MGEGRRGWLSTQLKLILPQIAVRKVTYLNSSDGSNLFLKFKGLVLMSLKQEKIIIVCRILSIIIVLMALFMKYFLH